MREVAAGVALSGVVVGMALGPVAINLFLFLFHLFFFSDFLSQLPQSLSPPVFLDLNRFLFSVWKPRIIAIYTLSPKPICAN